MAISLTQSITGNGTSIALNGVTSGALLTLQDTYERVPTTGAAEATPTDTQGTWATATSSTPALWASSNNDAGSSIFYQNNVASGTHTVTPGSATTHDSTLCEWAGAETSAFDVAASGKTDNSAATSQVTGTTASTAQADELVLIASALLQGTGAANCGWTDPVSGFTTLYKVSNTSSDQGTFHAYQIISTVGTQSATFNWTNSEANSGLHACIATFKAAATIITVNATPGTWTWTGSTSTVVRDPETAFQQNAFQSNAFQIYGGSTGAGPNTVNATPGTWSWSGANSPLAVQQISAAIGTWSWAGTTATIPTMIAATPGTWSWAGSAATIDIQQISQTVGTWSWAGSNSPPDVQQINQTTGTWSWTGSTQTISVQEINQTQGTWTWAGTTQTITTPGGATEINAAIGTWTWAGAQATFEVPQINQTTGTFSWVGSTSTIAVQEINTTEGTWTWTGTIQGIVQQITIDATPGLWSWTGTQATFGEEVVTQQLGGGRAKKRKYKKKYQVEIDGEVFDVESEEEAIALLDQAVEIARQQANLTLERAQKANKRPKRKVLADARKTLVIPTIEATRWIDDLATQAMLKIEEIYEDTLKTIEIGALLKKRDNDDEDDIETILMML